MPRRVMRPVRLVLGVLALSALVALLLWVDALDRGERGPHTTGPVPAPEVAEPEWRTAVPRATRVATRESAPVAAVFPVVDLRLRIASATAELIEALDAPVFEDEAWRETLRAHAAALGPEALPELESFLRDEHLSVEEEIAASELVSALRAR